MNRNLARIFLSIAAAAVLAFAADASAGTATTVVVVSATVAPTCRITAGAIGFGTYDPLAAADLDQTGAFTVSCAKGTGYTVTLGLGANASGLARRMTDGAASYLSYEVYNESGRTVVWNTTTGPGVVSGTAGSKAAITLTMYGRITAGQDVATGGYTDSIVSTVNF